MNHFEVMGFWVPWQLRGRLGGKGHTGFVPLGFRQFLPSVLKETGPWGPGAR